MGPVPGPGSGKNIELGHGTQVDAHEAEVDACQSRLANGGNRGLDCLGVLGNVLSGDHLMVIGVAGKQLRLGLLDDLNDLVGYVQIFMEHIHNGLTDHGVQGQQQQHGHKAPQAAAAHGDALLLVKLLDGLVLPGGIVGIPALDVLGQGGQTGHLHHALLGLSGNGQQHQLHDNGEQHQGEAVVTGDPVQGLHQIAEGHLDDVREVEC